jgi:hypothetical protein
MHDAEPHDDGQDGSSAYHATLLPHGPLRNHASVALGSHATTALTVISTRVKICRKRRYSTPPS